MKITETMKTKIKKTVLMLAVATVAITTAGWITTIEVHAAGWFDPVFYAQLYPDVAAAIGTDADALYNHYVNYGQKEGRIPYAGAMPGEAVDGIAGAEQTVTPVAPAQTQATTQLPSPQNPYVTVARPGSKYELTYDLSNWTSEQWDLFYKKQAEFDASDYVKVGWTEQQVYEKLMSLKSVYPEGTVVGPCGVGAGRIEAALYADSRDWGIGYDKNGERVYPIGYVYIGKTSCVNMKWSNETLKDTVKVGDKLYTKGLPGASHVSVVIAHDDAGITIVESNINDDKAMHWGRKISWDELENGGATIYQEQNKWNMVDLYRY